jgi:predicted alpha/beta superfamily hydrolase
LNALLFHRNQFDVYVALDPSFWWDKGFIYAAAERICATERFDACSLYVGVSSDRSQEVNNLHWTVARRFQTHALPKATERGLRAVWKNFPDETHGTIPFAGMLDVVKSELSTN